MEEARQLDRKLAYSGSCGEPGFHGPEYYENAEGLTFFLRVNGSNYGASAADLPQYRSCKALLDECVREAYMQAALMAQSGGLLGPSQLGQRLERARAWKR